ncbi:type III secretion system protein [Shewanella waksmanii]|uniref:type III secretion system protein n=1 Tax=Shewanella waksmanii TaxID=213783 RepID=UPI0037366621
MSVGITGSVQQPALGSLGLEEKNTGVSLDTKTWQNYDKSLKATDSGSVSMSDLLALIAKIIQSSQELRTQLMKSRIDRAMATMEVASLLATEKKNDATLRFGITLASSVVNMGLTTLATVRVGQTATLKDKHLARQADIDAGDVKLLRTKNLETGEVTEAKGPPKVSDLSQEQIDSYSHDLQQKRTAKYNSVSQMATMADGMVGNTNEMQHAVNVSEQEQMQADKDLKTKLDAEVDQYIATLTNEALKLNEILGGIAGASLATYR